MVGLQDGNISCRHPKIKRLSGLKKNGRTSRWKHLLSSSKNKQTEQSEKKWSDFKVETSRAVIQKQKD
jgi:hypothetical protein